MTFYLGPVYSPSSNLVPVQLEIQDIFGSPIRAVEASGPVLRRAIR
jgi:hypothetical protein